MVDEHGLVVWGDQLLTAFCYYLLLGERRQGICV
jgi:hypothetical protein